jgi:hypothetical protein
MLVFLQRDEAPPAELADWRLVGRVPRGKDFWAAYLRP